MPDPSRIYRTDCVHGEQIESLGQIAPEILESLFHSFVNQFIVSVLLSASSHFSEFGQLFDLRGDISRLMEQWHLGKQTGDPFHHLLIGRYDVLQKREASRDLGRCHTELGHPFRKQFGAFAVHPLRSDLDRGTFEP